MRPRVLSRLIAAVCAVVLLSTACSSRGGRSTAVSTDGSSEAPEFVATDAVVPAVTPVRVSVPRPSAEASVVIFWSPHPDDETLGMGQAVARYVRAGWHVYVALLTDGEDSRDFRRWYRRHPSWWRDLNGNGVKGDEEDFGLERRLEFERACSALGVPAANVLFYDELTRGAASERQLDVVLAQRMAGLVRDFAHTHPGALQITTMKYTDGALDGPGDVLRQSQHRIACETVAAAARRYGFPARFFKVYVYYLEPRQRWAPVVESDPDDHATKVRAMLAGYDSTDVRLHLGIGWHSVPVLFANARAGSNEYATGLGDFR